MEYWHHVMWKSIEERTRVTGLRAGEVAMWCMIQEGRCEHLLILERELTTEQSNNTTEVPLCGQ